VKRILDATVSAAALTVLSPLLVLVAVIIWCSDRGSPLYVAPRGARGGGFFRLIKFRSMSVGADKSGVDSTSATDPRLTRVGAILRRFKIDELPQLWNVLTGDMSLVGPRPQVPREIALYTDAEKQLLTVQPGITDFASIVFADEGEVLRSEADPDLAYNQLIRPWKSRLGLVYIQHASFRLDLLLLLLTAVTVFNHRAALAGVGALLDRLDVDELTRRVARRIETLQPFPPPGSSGIVTRRQATQATSVDTGVIG
jgi:lipopolysaccharide/colanic/teichoic acid biosynthesis glycosyltransferase